MLIIGRNVKSLCWALLIACLGVHEAIAKNYRIDFIKPGFFIANITGWMHYQPSDNEDNFVFQQNGEKLSVDLYYGNDIHETNDDFIKNMRDPDKQKVIIDEINGGSQTKNNVVTVRKGSEGFKKIGRLSFFSFTTNVKTGNKTVGYDYYAAVHKGRALTLTVSYPTETLDGESKNIVQDFLDHLVLDMP